MVEQGVMAVGQANIIQSDKRHEKPSVKSRRAILAFCEGDS
jgi:hypothetical protein